MMRPDAKVEKVYLYPKPVDVRKSIDGLAALVELDIKVATPSRWTFESPSTALPHWLSWISKSPCSIPCFLFF
ncbi:hypothetical protein [Pseudomonas amygdali]|uniref:hypothetical protein n=1 Tax=Pseudomonas amygdali TaxID=47877 RepID=UPI00211ECC88|nr:hypothetical protein [Pseudomonas amygdali]